MRHQLFLSLLRPFYQLFFVKYIENKYILPIYRKSHSLYQRDTAIGQSWIQLCDGLEVSLEINNYLDERPSRIAVRNVSDNLVKSVTLCIEADGYFDGCFKEDYYTIQQEITFRNIDYKAQTKILSDIPKLDVWVLDNGRLIFSYQNLYIHIRSITKNNVSQELDQTTRLYSCDKGRLLSDIENKHWYSKAGKNYNIFYINKTKQQIAVKIFCYFNPPPNVVHKEQYQKINIFLRAYWKINNALNRLLCFIILRDQVISLIFWVQVILDKHKIIKSSALNW